MMFKRPDMTQKVFELIRQVKPPKLLVIADGPRQDRPEEAELCAAARAVVDQVDWDCEVLKNYSDVNLGCRTRVYTGLDWVFQNVEEAIILEDDCVADPSFFRFCQELLERYRYDDRVMLIGGDNTHQYQATKYSYYFSQYALIWGWATWRHGWAHFRHDANLLFEELVDRNLGHAFDLDGSYPYMRMLADNAAGKNDSWAIRWHASTFLKGLLTLHPCNSLVQNIGLDGSGTHCGSDSLHQSSCVNRRVHVGGIEIEEDWKVREEFSRHLRLSSGEISIRSRLGLMLGRLIAPLRSKGVGS